jgi:hypothetical protein
MQAGTVEPGCSLRRDLPAVHTLCTAVLSANPQLQPSLVSAALQTLSACLPLRRPRGSSVDTLLPVLLQLLEQPAFSSQALQCLAKVCGSALHPHLTLQVACMLPTCRKPSTSCGKHA